MNQLNRLARVFVIQAIYSIVINNLNQLEQFKISQSLEDYMSLIEDLSYDLKKVDEGFVIRLINAWFQTRDLLSDEIKLFMTKDWKYERMTLITQIILNIAICESLNFETPKKVIISEYTTIAKSFLNENEVGFINGILQNIILKLK